MQKQIKVNYFKDNIDNIESLQEQVNYFINKSTIEMVDVREVLNNDTLIVKVLYLTEPQKGGC